MIVMGVITAVPFGLAIRQTLSKGPDADREMAESLDPSIKYEREMAESEARYARERAEREAAEAKEKAETRAAQRDVFGKAPATLGKLFDGIVLGAPTGSFDADAVRTKVAAAGDHHIDVQLELDLKGLAGLQIEVGGYEHDCAPFDEDLRAAWGPSTSGDADHGVWFAAGTRARFDVPSCKLTIERSVDAVAWIGHGDATVPLDYIGKPAKALAAKLGPAVDADETMMAWQQPGVGHGGVGLTTLTAEIAGGKIVAITAHADIDIATRSEIEERLTKLYGAPKEYPESGADLRWNGRPAVEVTVQSRSLELRAGK